MTDYVVDLERVVIVELAKLPRTEQERVRDKLRQLESNPRPVGVVKLTGAEGWRIRTGTYRIVYLIDDATRVITVTRIRHRKDVYRRL